jgi:hypothetical protein
MIDRFVETQARGHWREHFPEIAQYAPFDLRKMSCCRGYLLKRLPQPRAMTNSAASSSHVPIV